MKKIFAALFLAALTFGVKAQSYIPKLCISNFDIRQGQTLQTLPPGLPSLTEYTHKWCVIVVSVEDFTPTQLKQLTVSVSGMTELGMTEVHEKEKELWIYIGSGVNCSIKIKHNDYGTIRFKSEEPLLPELVYDLFLTTHDKEKEKEIKTASQDKTFIINGVAFDMVYVEGGTFLMGCPEEHEDICDDDEVPTHKVTVNSYYIGRFEVSQDLWEAVMGYNPSHFKGNKRPVECVSWYECETFANRLSELTGYEFRIPTEAEWEFAARGGNNSQHYFYSGSDTANKVSWFASDKLGLKKTIKKGTQNIGLKAPNELGLYDMSGNVYEWCYDWFGLYYIRHENNPTGPQDGTYRVGRGGSWINPGEYCRVSYRSYSPPGNGYYYLGLRIAMTVEK